MTIDTDEKKIDALLTRGVAEVIRADELKAKLLSGKQLRVKLGIDPTSPRLHLGRSVPLLKLRDFQQLGHQIVFIVGDATGVIGDTSDKESERPMLEQETIEQNKQGYFEQVGKIIDLDATELRYNSEWLNKLTYREIGEHADIFSVSDFISRENIKKRLDAGKRVSLREVLYPLMQGYDSVAVEADVEVGGSDQKFNILAGRPLQEHFGQPPQQVVLGPLIPGLDGRKMSSSWGNTINFLDEPMDMYGKVMSLRDELLIQYFEVFTRVPLSDVADLAHGFQGGALHPKEVKMRLAREIVTMYHGSDEAVQAEENFMNAFQKGGVPDDLEEVRVAAGSGLIEALVGAGVVASKAEARRLITAGAVSQPLSGDGKITDVEYEIRASVVLRVGKKRFVSFVV
jgi:tyrosyl-tRNA synthetase